MAKKNRDIAPDARFIFKGTVKRLKEVTAPGIPAADNAAVVRVDEVVQSPPLLSKLGGRDVTVYLDKKKIAVGEQAIFYTVGAYFGKGIAVESLDHHAVEKLPLSMTMHGNDPVKNLHARETNARMSSADLVVSGTVVAVRVPGTATKPIVAKPSEHDPGWLEAVIDVDDTHKGTAGQSLVVRFPRSGDVMWRDAPKFHVGQMGVFFLHKAKAAEAEAGPQAKVAAPTQEVYTALHPLDFHPMERVATIRPMLATLSPGQNS